MMKILLFYNADPVVPKTGHQADDWLKMKDPDTFKLAWTCAESWKRQGWQVERFRSPGRPSQFTGTLKNNIYPFNNFLFDLKAWLQNDTSRDDIWFTTSDVINFGYSAYSAEGHALDKEHFIPCASFTLAVGRVTMRAIDEMLHHLIRYDDGFIPFYPGLQADETILRHCTGYHRYCAYWDFMGCATESKPLTHYSRSCLQWFPKGVF